MLNVVLHRLLEGEKTCPDPPPTFIPGDVMGTCVYLYLMFITLCVALLPLHTGHCVLGFLCKEQ